MEMKKIISLSLLLCLSTIYGQKLSDYEYVYVPMKFKDYATNEYNLNIMLKKALEGKKYKVIQDDMANWSSELRQNPCKVITAELLNDSNMFRNRVKLQFTDCQKKVISETKGNSMYKEYDLGFQDALKESLVTIPVSMPTLNVISSGIKETLKEETPKPIDQKEIKEEVSTATSGTKQAESFTNGKVNLQKIQIAKDHFILVSSSSSVPFATFKNTGKADVYRVTLESGTSTLGYYENGNLIIEIPTSDGEFKKEVFMAK